MSKIILCYFDMIPASVKNVTENLSFRNFYRTLTSEFTFPSSEFFSPNSEFLFNLE